MSAPSFLLRFTTVVSLLALLGAGCSKAPSPDALEAAKPVSLEMWGVVDDADAYQPVIDQYRKAHPNVTITYRRLRLEEYEQKILEGFADDRGPDIFLIHNDWTGKYMPRIQPMPKTVKIGSVAVSGSFGGSRTWSMVEEPTITLREYRTQFADVVAQDTVRRINMAPAEPGATPDYQDKIMAIPVSVDTMAMYYNKDLLNAGGILEPPTSWIDFQANVEKLVKLDIDGQNFAQMAVALGTSNNIARAADILTVLMVQNGARMVNELGQPTFQQMPPDLSNVREEPPAYSALAFYTDFANPNKATYTWNANQPEALDAFAQGKTAFYFGYSYDLPVIKARAPKLNLGIAKLPQVSEAAERNVANYWNWTVAKKSKNTDVAWHFVNYLTKPEAAKMVLDVIKRPAARKGMLAPQLDDEQVGVFASQVLTAISWYKGNDPRAVEEAFGQLITDALNPQVQLVVSMRNAVNRISQTIQ
jgi:multiple sugar transport system substrate-binding protein